MAKTPGPFGVGRGSMTSGELGSWRGAFSKNWTRFGTMNRGGGEIKMKIKIKIKKGAAVHG